MLIKNDIPILEFDETRDAVINPCDIAKYTGQLGCERLVITFFREVIEDFLSDGKIEKIKTIMGENPYYVYKFNTSKPVLWARNSLPNKLILKT